MIYDTTSLRYAHLRGLTEEEIELVMLIADVAISQAQKEFRKRDECQIAIAEKAESARTVRAGNVFRDGAVHWVDDTAVDQNSK